MQNSTMNPSYNSYYSQQGHNHVYPQNFHQPQQQHSGTLYCIGAYAYPVMSQMSTNIVMNQPPLYRTFASVVVENPNIESANHAQNSSTLDNNNKVQNNNNNNHHQFQNYIKRVISLPSPAVQPQSYQNFNTHKEFEDFTKMPLVIQQKKQPQNDAYFAAKREYYRTVPPPNHPLHKTVQQQYQASQIQRQKTPSPPLQTPQPPLPPRARKNFFNTLMGNWNSYRRRDNNHHNNQQQQQQRPNNNGHQQQQQSWFPRGFNNFRCYRKNNSNNNNHHNNNNNNNSHRSQHHKFHHHDASNPKNVHEKERSSIERDIKNDFCDISGENSKFVDNNQLMNINETAKSTNNKSNCNSNDNSHCDSSEMNSPPFEILSHEEFPAIVKSPSSTVSPTSSSSVSSSSYNGDNEMDVDHDFVSYKDDAAATTPSYTPTWPPKRISLCEKVSKIVKSPQKLLALPTLATPKRSCLKPTPCRNRSVSECSDEFIFFAKPSGGDQMDDCDGWNSDLDDEDDDDSSDDDDDESSESESELSDDDTIVEEGEEIDEVDEAKREIDLNQQPDSGIDGVYEEKKVRFNLKPTVHVMRTWDHAYRQARIGHCWRQAALDRDRFKKRILTVEDKVKIVLHRDHREKIYKERFKEDEMKV